MIRMDGAPEDCRVHPALAASLLKAVALDPAGPTVQVFDRVFYPLLVWFSRKRAPHLARRILRPAGQQGLYVPGVLSCDVDAIAHDTAVESLRRARKGAHRFDPTKGDPIAWVVRNAIFAYVDIVRKEYGRQGLRHVPTEEADIEALGTQNQTHPSDGAVAQVEVGLAALDSRERNAIILHYHYGFEYDEISEMLFGSASETKRVGRLLEKARAKMLASSQELRA